MGALQNSCLRRTQIFVPKIEDGSPAFGWNMYFKQLQYSPDLKPEYLINIIFSRVFQMVNICGLPAIL